MIRKSKYTWRRRDRAYMAWIRSLPCLICGRSRSEAAHLGVRAFAQKCSDRETGPLCAWDHRLGPESHHALGRMFWQHHGIDRARLIRELNESYNAVQRVSDSWASAYRPLTVRNSICIGDVHYRVVRPVLDV